MALTIDLAGQVALVTGGARGVGRGITDRLLAAGATVAVAGRTAPDDLPDGVTFHAADVRDAEAAPAARRRRGRRATAGSTSLVNNAGGSPSVAAADASPRFSTRIVELNLLSALHLSTAARPALADAGGSIVNITSLSGAAALPRHRRLRRGQGRAGQPDPDPRHGVGAGRCGSTRCRPGWSGPSCSTTTTAGPTGAAAAEATVPMGRAATPAEVGDAVVFLASPLAAYVTGADLAGPRRRRGHRPPHHPRPLRPWGQSGAGGVQPSVHEDRVLPARVGAGTRRTGSPAAGSPSSTSAPSGAYWRM